MKKQKRIWSAVLAVTLALSVIAPLSSLAAPETKAGVTAGTKGHDYSAITDEAKSYIVVRNKPFGGSHYAYTEGLSDEMGGTGDPGPEGNDGGDISFRPGSELIRMDVDTSSGQIVTEETVLLKSTSGVIRDPDVSPDGTTVLFSWKKSASDDYHLYTMSLTSSNPESTLTQLTFGSGVADFEAKYLPNGKIVFSSSRCVQNIDCWHVPVSNLYICDPDGSNIIRVGYDQVHTTYPTVTTDGRVIYTRWDYNDRNQMFIQGLFQMQQDGTNQTELWGNGTGRTTTLLHPREIPGTNSKYVAIESGHHVWQAGKMVIIDTAKGRNADAAVTYAFPKDAGIQSGHNIDGRNQSGPLYRYPYALNETEYLVSYSPNGWSSNKAATPFGIYYMNTETQEKVEICKASNGTAASQFVPIKTRELFSRPSMVNYAGNTGTVYVANVYEGEGMEGFKRTADNYVKWLRVVALDFRASAVGANQGSGTGTSDPFTPVSTGNGAWDVKKILGIVPVEEDGSALFNVPSETPVYFQLLDQDGEMIASMRSWSTLQPGETFSCVGCHEDKNTVPPVNSKVTMAMNKGVQNLQKDIWMQKDMTDEEYQAYLNAGGEGFSYTELVQPILDANCIKCHNDKNAALEMINVSDPDVSGAVTILPKDATFSYRYSDNKIYSDSDLSWTTGSLDNNWKTGKGPFGANGTPPGGQNTDWPYMNKAGYLYQRTTFNLTADQVKNAGFILNIAFDESPVVYVNGKVVFDRDDYGAKDYIDHYENYDITERMSKAVKEGANTLAVVNVNRTGGAYIGFNLQTVEKSESAPERPYTPFVGIEQGGWAYRTSEPGEDWYEPSYTPSTSNGWTMNGTASFGKEGFSGHNPKTKWDSSNIWIRKNITLNADTISKINSGDYKVYANIAYDESPTVYLNGQKILSASGYSTNYVKIEVTSAFKKAMKSGTNVLAISASQTDGNCFIDCGFDLQERASQHEPQFALTGDDILGQREQMNYKLSYLALTGSTNTGVQFKGNSTNSITNWISAMSQCEVLEPYQFGSSQSNMISILEDGHYGVKLTDEELNTLRTWIDMGVPFRGEYDEANTWNERGRKEFEEKNHKRLFYNTLDEQVKAQLANGGVAPINLELDMTYSTGTGDVVANASGAGDLVMNVNRKLTPGDKITVNLPDDVNYLYFGIGNRLDEALIYVPSGTFTYTVPANMNKFFPKMVYSQISQTITARIPSEDEVKNTVQNLALNPYDLTNATSAYPHATATNTHAGEEFAARNAIDGFTNNAKGHGYYPLHSWGPEQSASTFTINFGRKITMDSFNIVLRGDFEEDNPSDGHDGGFTKAVAVLSDGTKKEFKIETTHAKQTFSVKDVFGTDTVKTESLKFELTPDAGKWSSLTEVEVMGTDQNYSLPNTGAPAITSLKVENGILDPSFSPRETNYTIYTSSDSVVIKNIQMNAFGEKLKVLVDGKETAYSASDGVTIPVGDQDVKVQIVVTGETQEATYTFNITSVDVSQLNDLIEKAQELVDNAVVGDKNGDYPQKAVDALKAAIAEAKEVAGSANLTDDDVMDAMEALNTAIDTFKKSAVTVNDTKLKDLIEQAQDKLDSTKVGTEEGQVSQAARDAFQKAIDAAKDVAGLDYRSQATIDAAYDALDKALNTFNESIIKPGDPGDPGDPSDPNDPNDPGDPTDPTDPSKPSKPGDNDGDGNVPSPETGSSALIEVALLAAACAGGILVLAKKRKDS